MPRLTLNPGRERSLFRRHPWIFEGSVAWLAVDVIGGHKTGFYLDQCDNRPSTPGAAFAPWAGHANPAVMSFSSSSRGASLLTQRRKNRRESIFSFPCLKSA
jgi:hypothetical protein